jgi:hypothetical protein
LTSAVEHFIQHGGVIHVVPAGETGELVVEPTPGSQGGRRQRATVLIANEQKGRQTNGRGERAENILQPPHTWHPQ